MIITDRYWGFYDRYVVTVRRYPEYAINRYYAHLIDPFLTKWAYDLRMSPDAVTTLALFAGLGTATCLIAGENIAAAILLQLHHLLDGADGNLARLTERCTPRGARYDQISDRTVRVVVFSTVAFMAEVSAAWSLAFLGVLLLDHFVVQLYVVPLMGRIELERAPWKAWFLDRGIIPGFDHFTLFFLISVFAIAGRLDLLVYLATALKALDLGYRLWECAKSQGALTDTGEIALVAKPADFWTVEFDYWFSVRIVSLVRNSPVSPDHLTFASFASALLGAAALMLQPLHSTSMIAAALLFQTSYIFDCADGQLARLRGQYSRHGWRLDLYSDRLTETIILVSATFALASSAPSYWLLGMSALGVTTFLQYSRVHELMHAATFESEHEPPVATRASLILRRAIEVIERARRKYRLGFFNVGNFYFLNFIFLVAGRMDLFLWSVVLVAGAASVFHIARSAAKQAEAEAGLRCVARDECKAVLFGAGEGAAQFVTGFRNRNVEIAYVCDNNAERWGTRFFGVPIGDPESLRTDADSVVVFVASEWSGQICAQVKALGVPSERVVSLY